MARHADGCQLQLGFRATRYWLILDDADRSGTTVPHAKSSVVLHIELDAECYQQPTIVVDCRPHLPHRPSPLGAVNTRPTGRCRCLYQTRRQSACKFCKLRVWNNVQEGRTLIFCRYLNFAKGYNTRLRETCMRKISWINAAVLTIRHTHTHTHTRRQPIPM